MAYRGVPVFPQTELESVRRARKEAEVQKAKEVQEYGVKGMRWGEGSRAKRGAPKGYVKAGKDYWTGKDRWVPSILVGLKKRRRGRT